MPKKSTISEHKKTFLRMLMPVILSMVLFITMVFFYILPSLENALIDKKRETIHELVEITHNTLAQLKNKADQGIISEAEAKDLAIDYIKNFRYGPESKDYFWINDMEPRMIMHPYRSDLDGTNIANFTDPNGKHLFASFVEAAKDSGEGYISYMWQWKDDPTRIVPKISYVKLFEPWQWIIGTGIYTEDVREEIETITKNLSITIFIILIIILSLLSYNIWESYLIEEEKLQAQQELKKSNKRLKELDKLKDDFVSIASHELRTPMTVINNYSSILASETFGTINKKQRRFIEKILNNTKRLIGMVNDLLDVSKLEANKMNFDLKKFNIAQETAEIVEDMEPLFGEKPVNIEYNNITSKKRIYVNADPEKTHQVLINLLGNAFKFTPKKGTVTLSLSLKEEFVQISVKDTGIGIPKKHMDEIFEKFSQAHETLKRDYEGTGLGLAIVKKLIKGMGGEIWAQSTEGKGSTFSFTLPLYKKNV